MDYSYLEHHNRQKCLSASENGKGNPPDQYPVHCEYQQYPTAHQVMSKLNSTTGYPSGGFASYIHPTSANAGIPSQEGLNPSRMMTQDSTSISSISSAGMPFRTERQPSMDLQHILPAVALQPRVTQSDAVFHDLDRSTIIQHNPSRTSSGPSLYTVSSCIRQGRREEPRPPLASSESVTSEMNSKSCQTEPLFDMLPEAARTLSSSFDLIEGLSYKITGQELSPGVVVTKDLQKGEEFGPFTGEFVDDECGIIDPTSWEVCVRGKPGLYISGTCDPNNWMSHVQVARCREEQNMEAFQFYGDIFFRTTKSVEAGTELRVFYSKDYCRKVGLGSGLEELSFDQGFGQFRCTSCENHYSNAKSLLRHIKFEHDKENVPVAPQTGAEQHPSRTEEAGQNARSILKVKEEMISVSEMESTSKDPARKGEKRKRSKTCDVSERIQLKFIPPKLKKSSVMIKKMENIHPFTCSLCQKQFPSKEKLVSHCSFHKEIKVLNRICDECGVSCKGKEELRFHKKSHRPNALQCPVCHRYYNYQKRMLVHLRSEHQFFKGKKWSSREVADLMNSLKVAGDQQGAVNKNNGPKCIDCRQYFEDEESFKQHECTQGTYTCQYCDKVFQKNSQMVAHLHQEHKMERNMEVQLESLDPPEEQVEDPSFHPNLPRDEHPFSCKVCRKQFTSKGKLEAHSAFHKEVRSLNHRCDECGVLCKGKEELRFHKKSHRPNALQCPICHRYYNYQKRMIVHLRSVHQYFSGKKWSQGDIADLMKSLKVSGDQQSESNMQEVEDLSFHPNLPRDMLGRKIALQVKNPRMFKCKYCPKLYTKFNICSRHEREMHTFSGNFMCEFCSASFLSERKYLIHKSKHTNDRLYKCTECPQSYSSQGALDRHIRDHRGEYPHKCDICAKGFRTRKNMLSHKRETHDPPKVLYQCQFCPRKLKNKASHKAHEKCHKGIRPHMCFTCSKAFRDTHSLKRHMLTHTGEKPHECEVCQQRFRLPHQLFDHKFKHKIDERRQAEKERERQSSISPEHINVQQSASSSAMVNQ